MQNLNTHQISFNNLDYPFGLIESIFADTNVINKICDNPIGKIKAFIGSDININGSGFLFQGKNNHFFSFECYSKNIPNFMKSYSSKILYINNSYIEENILLELNIYKNTDNNSTVIEFCLIQSKNNDKNKCLIEELLNFGLKKHFLFSLNNIKKHIDDSSKTEYMKLYHSMIFKSDLEYAYKLFRDFNNTAKVLGTDKIWDIKKKNSFYSVNIGNGIIINYHRYKETENFDKSKSIFYHKFKGDSPALNEWTKIDFFKIDDKNCLIIHETKIPKNINSNLYNTLSNFTIYVLKKLKYFIESSYKDSKN
jgi:hypothetical protein